MRFLGHAPGRRRRRELALLGREGSVDDRIARALERIARDDDRLNAFSYIDTSARSSSEGSLAELHGTPVAVKDLIDVGGMPTTASSKVLSGNRPEQDATVVARLRSAGAVIVGKTNLDEFAYGVLGIPTRNPWDPERISGGSSGGSAAAVAMEMCDGALGTDTAGSIRIPSALCGVFGLTPRRVVDMTGVIPLAPSLDRCGPMARDPSTLAAMWSAMGGARSTPPRNRFTVAVSDVDDLDLDPEVAPRYAGAISTLQADDSTELVTRPIPSVDRWRRPGGIVLGWEAWQVHNERGWFPRHAALYTPWVRKRLDRASGYTTTEIDEARSGMEGLRSAFDELMEGVDGALMPTTPCLAPRRNEIDEETYSRWSGKLTRFPGTLNFCDLAAVTIPLWDAGSHLPWGIDAVARDEWTALELAAKLR